MGNPWPGWGMDGKTPLRHKRVRMRWCRISEGVCYWGAGGSGVCLGAAECCRDWSASSSNGSGAGHVEQHCLAQAQQCSAPLPPSSPFIFPAGGSVGADPSCCNGDRDAILGKPPTKPPGAPRWHQPSPTQITMEPWQCSASHRASAALAVCRAGHSQCT